MDLDHDEQDRATPPPPGGADGGSDDAGTEWSDIDTDDVRSRTSAELYVVRPNRWKGKPNAWKRMTASDRLVTSSLDKVRNRDLAVHLYNAHALKTRKRKGPWDGDARWKPRALWTAWPQRLTRMRPRPAARASEALEEVLTATALRLAKERFRGRPDFQGAAWDEQQRAEMAQRLKKNPGRRAASDGRGGRPTMTSDDDGSAALLRPSVRHVLAQLDRTLTMLHDVRVVGLAEGRRDGASSGEETEGTERSRSQTKESTPKTSEDTPRRTKKRRRSGRPVAAGITENQAQYLAQWGLRDWSDVLGAAALAGFDGAVVARTAQRCADLFGQSMLLDTMQEGRGRRQPTVVRTKYEPQPDGQRYRVVDGDVEEEWPATEERLATRESPEPGEAEEAEETEKAEKQTETETEKAEKGKEKETETEKELKLPKDNPKGKNPQSKGMAKVYVPARKSGSQYTCPFGGCSRAADGFDRRFNLVRHLRLVHSAEASTDPADTL